MHLIKLAVAALNQTPLEWNGNRENILRSIREARNQGAAVLCLPELCVSGYGCEDVFHSPFLLDECLNQLSLITPETKGLFVSVGVPISHQGALFNCACIIADGSIRGFVAKKNLAGDGIHYEPRWFKPWPHGVAGTIELPGGSYPIGDIYFDVSGVKIGFEICEDAWVADRPGRELALRGVDVILNPSASHFAFGKRNTRRQFVLEGARAFNVSYAYANLLGCEAGRIIYDGDCLIASAGKVLTESKRFSFEQSVVTSAVVDIDLTRTIRARTTSYRPILTPDPACIPCPGFELAPAASAPGPTVETQLWEKSQSWKEEEFTRAVCLALFDYLRKCHMGGFMVSLSGGADSSAVSCLVAKMIELGVSELGVAGFVKSFPSIESLAGARSVAEIVPLLLTCVYQRTNNNSEITRSSAKAVAESLGAVFHEFEIDPAITIYQDLVTKALGRPLTWESDDTSLQNVQARARVPGLWLLANCKRSLLLTCSNRSEAAVGYATMDGDTAGGLNPIGGIDKDFLRGWLRWMQDEGPIGLSKVPALSHVTAQQPTAELRPLVNKQTDEDDLMPYSVLNRVELLAIRDKKSPLEVFAIMRSELSASHNPQTLAKWVEKFFVLWSINQWKRERYAPCFHLDDENLDPKTWCRFPILSSGFKAELEALQRHREALE